MRNAVITPEEMQLWSPLLRLPGIGMMITRGLMHLLSIDRVNALYARCCDKEGWAFARALLEDLHIHVDYELEPEAAQFLRAHDDSQTSFVTVSNHPLGALDGIALIAFVGARCGRYKLFVNSLLMKIEAMQPNFIPVDLGAKNALNQSAIFQAMQAVSSGVPIGFFPAGSVSGMSADFSVTDGVWKESQIRLIQKLALPVLPIYIADHNSLLFYLLGGIDWHLRSLCLPAEVFRKRDSTLHLVVRRPIEPLVLRRYESVQQLASFLRFVCYGV